jgi:hypothetical protein
MSRQLLELRPGEWELQFYSHLIGVWMSISGGREKEEAVRSK